MEWEPAPDALGIVSTSKVQRKSHKLAEQGSTSYCLTRVQRVCMKCSIKRHSRIWKFRLYY
jgi:hypothetical protein